MHDNYTLRLCKVLKIGFSELFSIKVDLPDRLNGLAFCSLILNRYIGGFMLQYEEIDQL